MRLWRRITGGLSVTWILSHYGAAGTVRWMLRSLPYHVWLHAFPAGRRELMFDRINHVDTGGIIEPGDLGVAGHEASVANAVHYAPSRPKRFLQLLASLPIDYSQFVFVDIGAGKGRALLLAARFPFKRIIGVEFAPSLAAIARRNVDSHSSRGPGRLRPVEVICADAIEYELPHEDLVLYLFNPFGSPVFNRFIAGIERSLQKSPRTIYFLYWSPMCEVEQARSSRFEKIAGRRDLFAVYRTRRLGSSTNTQPITVRI